MMSVRETESGKRVDIRTRRILARDGTEVARLTIFCPVRRASQELDECRECESCEEIVIDPADRDSAVRCRAAFEEPLPQDSLRTPVIKLMTRHVICIRADLTINELIMTLYENGISGAPVVDARGKVLGVVSKTDLLRDSYEKVELAEDKSERHLRGDAEDRSASKISVQDLMSTSLCSLPESATIAEAAALMALEGVRRIPILDAQDQVVGIICASDILSWLARQAGYVVPCRFPLRR
jgi:CBS domain-containing protein